MRVLFTSTSGSGHIQPLVPLAQALLRAGHEVRVATPAASAAVVEAAGLRPIAAGRSWPEWRALGHYPDGAAFASVEDWLIAFQTRTVRGVAAREFAADLLPALRHWRPDVIVRDSMEFGGYLAGELLDIPHAVGSFIWFLPERLRRHYDAALNALRQEHGLPTIGDPIAPYPYLALPGMPRRWVADEEWAPPTAHFLRPVPFNQWQHDPLPDWFDRLPARPIVHAAVGSTDAFGNPSALFTAIVEALRDAPVNLVLAGGRHQVLQEYDTLPANVHLEAFYPYNRLLPRCAAFITHAGYGSVMAALSVGLPLVALPLGADQFRNGRRIVDLGVGVMLPPEQRTPEQIRPAVCEVLEQPSYRDRSGELATEIAVLPPPEHGVALLEQLARERRPILAEAASTG
jgi:UDP:flavonoid glycosyltransferase YjiC (YdhE family)